MTNWIERAQILIRKTTAPEVPIEQAAAGNTEKSPGPPLPVQPKSSRASFGDGDFRLPELRAELPVLAPCPPTYITRDGVGEPAPHSCPFMPKGIRLIQWKPKIAPVVIDRRSEVVDVSKFIESELRALDARLNNPWTIHGGFTVSQMLDRLAQAGLEVELEPKGEACTTNCHSAEYSPEIK